MTVSNKTGSASAQTVAFANDDVQGRSAGKSTGGAFDGAIANSVPPAGKSPAGKSSTGKSPAGKSTPTSGAQPVQQPSVQVGGFTVKD